jgi:hypothetical protein
LLTSPQKSRLLTKKKKQKESFNNNNNLYHFVEAKLKAMTCIKYSYLNLSPGACKKRPFLFYIGMKAIYLDFFATKIPCLGARDL